MVFPFIKDYQIWNFHKNKVPKRYIERFMNEAPDNEYFLLKLVVFNKQTNVMLCLNHQTVRPLNVCEKVN